MTTPSNDSGLYTTGTVLRRQLRVRYPLTEGLIALRTELDWGQDFEATSVLDEGTTFTFELEAKRPFLYFKSCWKVGNETRWAVGSNRLVLMTAQGSRDVYPHFQQSWLAERRACEGCPKHNVGKALLPAAARSDALSPGGRPG